MKEELSWCKVNYIYIYITFEKALEYLEYQIVARDGCVIIFEKKNLLGDVPWLIVTQ